MSMKTALFEYLSSVAALTALVDDRIYHLVGDEKAGFPFVVYQRIGNEHGHHLGGSDGTSSSIYQLTIWAKTPPDAEDVAEIIRLNLDSFHGNMGTVDVRLLHLQDERDNHDGPTDGSAQGPISIQQDYQIIHREPLPVTVN